MWILTNEYCVDSTEENEKASENITSQKFNFNKLI